jgi:hypothetical protein
MTVVSHDAKPYLIEQRGAELLIGFRVSRYGFLSGFCWVIAVFLTPLALTIILHADGMVIACVTGGTISLIAVSGFLAAPYLIQKELSIGPDLILVRTTLFNVPVSATKAYPLNVVTDLEPDIQEFHGMIAPWCSLRFWANGKSVELERAFPLAKFNQFVQELSELGVRFPATFEKS